MVMPLMSKVPLASMAIVRPAASSFVFASTPGPIAAAPTSVVAVASGIVNSVLPTVKVPATNG